VAEETVDARIQKRVEELREAKPTQPGLKEWMKPGSVWESLPTKRKEGWEGTPSRSEIAAAEPLKFSGHDWSHVDPAKLLDLLEKLIQHLPIRHKDFRWIMKDELPKTTERVHMLLAEDNPSW